MGTVTGLDVKIRFLSDFRIGSGLGRGREIDSAVLRDEGGRVYLPGSTVKGLARTALRRLLAMDPLHGMPACAGEPYDDGDIAEDKFAGRCFEGLCGVADPVDWKEEDFDPPCVLCRVFGNAGRQAGIAFGNAHRTETSDAPNNDAASDRRLGVLSRRSMRSRQTGTAEEQALFTEELAASDTFRMELRPTGTCHLHDRDWLLLAAALRTIREMGGGRRRGHGQCQVETEFRGGRWDGARLPVEDEGGEAADNGETPVEALDHLLEKGTLPRETPDEVPVERGERSADTAPEGRSAGAAASPARTPGFGTLTLVAVAREPLALARRPDAGNKLDVQFFVPGSSVRGALAWRMIRHRGLGEEAHEDGVFARGFLEEGLRFTPLYPALRQDGKLALGSPVPRSVVTCRDRPGFRADGGHGVVDRLQAGPDALEISCSASVREDGEDSACGGRMVPYGGFYAIDPKAEGESGRLRAVEVPGRIRYQTAVDDDTGRAKEGLLYGTRLVEAGTMFAGHVRGRPDDLDQLRELFGQDEAVEIRVGRARTRGRGRLALALVDSGAGDASFPALHPSAEERIPDPTKENEIGTFRPFTLTLHSDLIAIDPWLHPVTELDGPALWRLLGGEGKSPFRLDWAYADIRRVHGWLGKPGLPRSADVALIRGSCFSYVARQDDEVDVDPGTLVGRLRRAERTGLGLRRGEGFGAVVVNHPLHQAFVPKDGTDEASGTMGSTDERFPPTTVRVPGGTDLSGATEPDGREETSSPPDLQVFYRKLAQHLGEGGIRFLRWAGHHPDSAVDAFRNAAAVLALDHRMELPEGERPWQKAERDWNDTDKDGKRRALLWWGFADVSERFLKELSENSSGAGDEAVARKRLGAELRSVARGMSRGLEAVRGADR